MGAWVCLNPGPHPTSPWSFQGRATHQQGQRDGHEHSTACHASQANEVQSPPSSSLYHEQLWTRKESYSLCLVWCLLEPTRAEAHLNSQIQGPAHTCGENNTFPHQAEA